MQYLQKHFFLILSFFFVIFGAAGFVFFDAQAETLAQKLSGRILLQVEQNGEAWYIYPKDLKRYYMGRPTDAFNLMRGFGVGITNKDLEKIPVAGKSGDTTFSSKYKGIIFLQVEENGEAWYVNPVDVKRYFLGRPDDAFAIMRSLGLGITDKDLANISEESGAIVPPSSSSVSISLEGGETVYFGNGEKLSRPEFCIQNNRAYLTLRHTVQSESTNRAVNKVSLKIFDIESNGAWKDATQTIFGTDFYALYPESSPDGYLTDHQFACTGDGFLLSFEAGFEENNQSTKHLIVYRLSSDFKVEAKAELFKQVSNIAAGGGYKSDDPGLAILNNTVWVWTTKLDTQRNGVNFAMYGLDPTSLAITKHDGKNGPMLLENTKASAFNGVLDFVDGEYRLLSSPRDPLGTSFASDGLIDYRYDTNWKFLGANQISDSFGEESPLYTTGRLHTSEFEIWGFTLQPPERRSTPTNVKKTAAANQYTNVGTSYARIIDNNGKETYINITENDTLGKSDDTRHIEFALSGDTLYVGYQYLTDKSTIVKKYQVVRK